MDPAWVNRQTKAFVTPFFGMVYGTIRLSVFDGCVRGSDNRS